VHGGTSSESVPQHRVVISICRSVVVFLHIVFVFPVGYVYAVAPSFYFSNFSYSVAAQQESLFEVVLFSPSLSCRVFLFTAEPSKLYLRRVVLIMKMCVVNTSRTFFLKHNILRKQAASLKTFQSP
jgi:hypothetical protein